MGMSLMHNPKEKKKYLFLGSDYMTKKKVYNKKNTFAEKPDRTEIIDNLSGISNEEELEAVEELPVIEKVEHRIPGTNKKVDISVTDILEEVTKSPVKEIPIMPPTSEIFSIQDLGDKKLVIKKDGTKLYIGKW